MFTIRPAKSSDLSAITAIYNEAILTTTATFDTEPKTDDEQEVWFREHGPRNPVLVAEQDGTVIGWASLSQWSTRCAYADTVEASLYIKEEFRGRGAGKKLLAGLLETGEKAGLHSVLARIESSNKQSIHLAETLGFEPVGIMREVGKKFDKMLDVCLMQKILINGGGVR
ncbi:MAG: N-acetyltransferase family protein [Chloroflexota bacterium]